MFTQIHVLIVLDSMYIRINDKFNHSFDTSNMAWSRITTSWGLGLMILFSYKRYTIINYSNHSIKLLLIIKVLCILAFVSRSPPWCYLLPRVVSLFPTKMSFQLIPPLSNVPFNEGAIKTIAEYMNDRNSTTFHADVPDKVIGVHQKLIRLLCSRTCRLLGTIPSFIRLVVTSKTKTTLYSKNWPTLSRNTSLRTKRLLWVLFELLKWTINLRTSQLRWPTKACVPMKWSPGLA